MALSVEVAGYGICKTNCPYAVMVICVQQEAFQAWTVYRRYNTFVSLCDQLRTLHPTTSAIPSFNSENLNLDYLEDCRSALDTWLRTVSSNSMILRTQSMYHFLCVEANQPPPGLEIHWRASSNGSFDDEMEMDDMFGMEEDDDGEQNYVDKSAVDDDIDRLNRDLSRTNRDKKAYSHGHRGGPRQYSSDGYNAAAAMDDGENDGLDIQSLSVVQAEFLYDRLEEEKAQENRGPGSSTTNSNKATGNFSTMEPSLSTSVAEIPKRTINLDSFHIIKCIGKG